MNTEALVERRILCGIHSCPRDAPPKDLHQKHLDRSTKGGTRQKSTGPTKALTSNTNTILTRWLFKVMKPAIDRSGCFKRSFQMANTVTSHCHMVIQPSLQSGRFKTLGNVNQSASTNHHLCHWSLRLPTGNSSCASLWKSCTSIRFCPWNMMEISHTHRAIPKNPKKIFKNAWKLVTQRLSSLDIPWEMRDGQS